MLDRQVAQEFLKGKLKDWKIKIHSDIDIKNLTEAFCLYVEDDYYQWLEENSKSFFAIDANGVDWDSIMSRINQIN
ncbi:MAG: hypothetical protein JNK81_05320 [Anaerolineales bacterium]|nr:hypothetical protein [Anaerolineales bacterium]